MNNAVGNQAFFPVVNRISRRLSGTWSRRELKICGITALRYHRKEEQHNFESYCFCIKLLDLNINNTEDKLSRGDRKWKILEFWKLQSCLLGGTLWLCHHQRKVTYIDGSSPFPTPPPGSGQSYWRFVVVWIYSEPKVINTLALPYCEVVFFI